MFSLFKHKNADDQIAGVLGGVKTTPMDTFGRV
jgi:hypothetical protein